MPVSNEKRASEGNTSASSLKNKTPLPCQKQNRHQEGQGREAIRDNDMFSIQNFTPGHN